MEYNVFDDTNAFSKESLVKKKCPTCGTTLYYKAGDKDVVCMACGNTYRVKDIQSGGSAGAAAGGAAAGGIGSIKVEGMKTPSSALAYLEQYLDDYDWKSFAYDSDYIIDEFEAITSWLKKNAADDFKTWYACIISLAVPFAKKLEYQKEVYQEVVDEYKRGSLEAEGSFEALRLTAEELVDAWAELEPKLNKYLEYAEKVWH